MILGDQYGKAPADPPPATREGNGMTIEEAQAKGAVRCPVRAGLIERYWTRRQKRPGIKVGYCAEDHVAQREEWVFQWHMAVPPHGKVGLAWAEWCSACLPTCTPHPQRDTDAWDVFRAGLVVRPAAVWLTRAPNGGPLQVAAIEPGRVV